LLKLEPTGQIKMFHEKIEIRFCQCSFPSVGR
jgi:hypothetical protein